MVVPSVNGLEVLVPCLEALLTEAGQHPLEIMVPDRCGGPVGAYLEQHPDPRVHWLPAAEHTSIPRLRSMGFRAAAGSLVVVLEDHCNVVAGWLDALLEARSHGPAAIGGAVENGKEDAISWMVFLSDYGRFLPPLSGGAGHEITGNNTAYDRSAFEQEGIDLERDVWEGVFFSEMENAGLATYRAPDMLVVHDKAFDLCDSLAQRFHYSRSFAAERMSGSPLGWRLLYAASTAVLPPLLLWRITRTAVEKRRARELFRALPFLPFYVLVWALGEAAGALIGAGRSLERVE